MIGFAVVAWSPTAGAEQVTFEYTGGVQEFAVPPNVCAVTIDSFGAEGGSAASPDVDTGGGGGETRATIAVTPGSVL